MDKIRVLALSGSLRRHSLNTAAIQTLQSLAPDYIEITQFSLGKLPLFNPDREDESIESVESLKRNLQSSHGLIIASPEYAHGVTGVMKNALDWLVSGEEFVDKPIMLINTSPRATHAQDALKEILKTMSGRLIKNAHVTVPLLGSGLDMVSIRNDEEIVRLLSDGLSQFHQSISESF
ncbi:NAD(P)H-dependent oxidoreductase [Marinomonas sp. C2222]|uniref:NAD(P)H-dependent oxidoreductase n=1 Tax=Marinomonas sargassi TaxID=2984494 RepID=A0ABT2YPA3_9GAMM|nr:NADPH-dependent FMN reductase [Marinomonas sargassi]MCV2401718.1 NAD(P)H-dependent oxidoreductase [Marinomonas sargassi]